FHERRILEELMLRLSHETGEAHLGHELRSVLLRMVVHVAQADAKEAIAPDLIDVVGQDIAALPIDQRIEAEFAEQRERVADGSGAGWCRRTDVHEWGVRARSEERRVGK